MEQFSCQISFGRKTAAAQEGQDLTMDRKPGPSQQKGGQCQPSGQIAFSGQGGDAGGDLQKAGEKPLGPHLVKAKGREQKAHQPGQKGKNAG